MSISRSIAQPLSQPIVKSLTGKLLWQSIKQSLFASGAEGGLYPISDLKRQGQLYTDSALSTVLTDAGDPMGGGGDLSGNGNPLTQATDTDRPVYGIVPFGGRRNLLTYSTAITDANSGWSGGGVTEERASVLSGETAHLVKTPVDSGGTGLVQDYGVWDGKDTLRVMLEVETSPQVVLALRDEDTPEWTAHVTLDTADGSYSLGFSTTPTVSVVDKGTGPNGGQLWEITITSETNSNGKTARFWLYPSGSGSANGGTGTIFHWAQIEDGDTATPLQIVRSQYEVTESGKQTAHVLHFNGTNMALDADYPAGTYTVCVAGIKGSWFGEISHAGGAFDIGPTTVTGGPADLLAATGEVVAFIPREGSISAAQKSRILDYVQQLGAGEGEVTP